MSTSAYALQELLAKISSARSVQVRFLDVAADTLRIVGPDREAEALLTISRMVRMVRSDLESIGLNDAERSALAQHLDQFNGLTNFSHAHFDLENARRNFLAPQNINGLIYIHLALKGLKIAPNLHPETIALADIFRSLRQDVVSSSLPE